LTSAVLRLDTTTAAFDRRVTVADVGADGSTTAIGGGRIVRTASPGAAADGERSEVPIAPAHGDKLKIEIADGDSPALQGLTVSVRFHQPALLFALPAGSGDEAAGVLRFGGRRAYAPRYDLAELFADAHAASVARLADPSQLPVARLGEIRANPAFDAAPALGAVARAGAKVERDAWRWQRVLEVPASPEGLVRVRLAPDDLAAGLVDHADLRVIDGDERQWPYVVAPATERVSVDLQARGPTSKDGTSLWRTTLPASPLLVDRLAVQTGHPVLNRRYRIVTHDDGGDEQVLAAGTLAQDLRRPGPIVLTFPPARVTDLELRIEDGNDAPSDVTEIAAQLALPSLLLAAPPGSYTLLAGNPDAKPPQYELERARSVVLDLRSVPATSGAGAANPHWTGTPGGTVRRDAIVHQLMIWAVIGLAVLLLGVLTLRIARGD
jgi:hypothetical protein